MSFENAGGGAGKNRLTRIPVKTPVVKNVEVADDSDVLQVDEEVFDTRKSWTIKLDEVLKNERGSKELIEKLDDHIQVGLDKYYEAIDKNGGGDGSGKNSLELYGTTGGSTVGNKRLRGHAG